MSDSTINLMSYYEGETSFSLRVGTSPDSHLPPLGHNLLELEVIYVCDDSDLERVFGSSLEKETSSSDSLEAFYKMLAEKLIASRSLCLLPYKPRRRYKPTGKEEGAIRNIFSFT